MPKQETVVREKTQTNMVKEITDNSGNVIGHKCDGGFPFKGEGSYNKALAQYKAMKKKDK